MAERTIVAAGRALTFGPFRLLPTERLLLEEGEPVRLGSRALDILIALTERPGELVGKAELLARVWPDRFVEEGNLKFQIAALRRVLGDGHRGRRFIATSSGQGYRFVAPVAVAEESSRGAPPALPPRRDHNLPGLLVRLIGRSSTVATIAARLPRQRFVTIVGTGGIGKTSVAVAVAQNLLDAYEDGVWLVDLAPITAAGLVATALAAAVGCEIRVEDPLAGLIAFLEQKRMLLVLDNCEHVVDVAASLAVAVLKGAAGVHILATSREPLRVQGEHLYRLPALEAPPMSPRLDAAEALAFPAVELFVERAAASLGEYELGDADAPIVAEICRRLDGIPLAIELAAARLDAFGTRGLQARLDDRLQLLTRGARSAPSRHSTLRATLDWSYGLLTEAEQQALRRLAIFPGSFTLGEAVVVAAQAAPPEGEIIGAIAELVSKSLVMAETGDAEPRLRLPETTRAHAAAKLRESGEYDMVARRHAEFYRNFFECIEAEQDRSFAALLAEYRRHIDNLRAALEWAFSANGDAAVGTALTAAAVPLWVNLSLLEECRRWVEQALAAIAAGADRDARHEMKLRAGLSASLSFNKSANPEIVPEIGAAWTKALELAESLGDTEYRLRSLWGLWFAHTTSGRHRIALTVAQTFSFLTANRPDPNDRLVGEQMIGVSQHYLGDQACARRHLEAMLSGCIAFRGSSYITRFQIDLRVAVRAFLAWVLWLQGFPDQAMCAAGTCVADASATDHPISLCYALAMAACPLALLVGDLAAAEQYAKMLLDHAAGYAPARWQSYGQSYQAVLVLKRGDVAGAVRLLSAGLDKEVKAQSRVLRAIAFLTAEDLGHAGEVAGRLVAVEKALAWAGHSDERWLTAELLRIKGELLLMQDAPQAAGMAEDQFRQALALSRQQGALSWELRAATSLARLLRDRDRIGEARDLLSSVYVRFTEGYDSADLQIARKLIDDLD